MAALDVLNNDDIIQVSYNPMVILDSNDNVMKDQELSFFLRVIVQQLQTLINLLQAPEGS